MHLRILFEPFTIQQNIMKIADFFIKIFEKDN